MREKEIDDKKKSVILFITVFTMFSLVYMAKQCFNSAMADIVNEGFLTKTQTGFIIMIYYVIYAPMQIAGGIAADKYDSGKLIMIGLIGSAISNAVIFLNNSYYVMVIMWGFNAFTQFALWPSVLKILTSKLHIIHRRKAVAYITMGMPLGAIAAYLTAVLIKRWQYNFAVSSVALFTMAAVFYIVYSYVNKHMSFVKVNETESMVSLKEKNKTLKISALIFCSGLFFVLIISFMKDMVVSGIKGLSPIMLMETYEYVTPPIGNSLNIIIILFGIFGVLISGIVNTHYRKRELEILIIIWILTVPAWIALVFIGKISIPVCVLSLAWIYGLVTAGAATINCWVIQFQKYNCAGTVAGMINAATCVGIITESYFFCVIADNFGWNYVIYLCILLCLISEILTLFASFSWGRFNKEEHG